MTDIPGLSRSIKDKLRVRPLGDDIDDGDLVCDCDGDNPPQNGEDIIPCRMCDKWQHMNCQVGNSDIPKTAAMRGFQCRSCKTKRRSDAGKFARARDVEKRAIGRTSLASMSSPTLSTNSSTGKKFGLGTRSRPAAQKQESLASMSSPLSSPPPSTVKSFSLGTRSRPAVQKQESLAERASEDIERYDTPLVQEEEEAGDEIEVTPALLAKSKVPASKMPSGKAHHTNISDHYAKTPTAAAGRIEHAPQQIADMPLCKCTAHGVPAGTAMTTCYECDRFHVASCLLPPEQDRIGEGLLCEGCLKARTLQFRAIKVYQARKRQYHENARNRYVAVHYKINVDDLKICIAKPFWKTYCMLPNTSTTPPAIVDITAVIYNGGAMQPIHPAPQYFKDNILHRIGIVLVRVGEERVSKIAGPDGALVNPKNPDWCLRTLREMSVLVMYQPERKMKREELDILAELLGLEDKGRYWKG